MLKVEKSSVNNRTEGEGRRWECIREGEERNGAQDKGVINERMSN